MSSDNEYAPVTPAFLKGCFGVYGKVMANTVDGELYLTNAYFVVPASHQFAGMMKTYEIPSAPGVFDILGKQIRLSTQEPPAIDKVMPAEWNLAEKSEGWVETSVLKVPGISGPVFSSAEMPAILLTSEKSGPVGASWQYLRAIMGGIDLHVTHEGFIGGSIRRTAGATSERRRLRIFTGADGRTTTPLVVIVEQEGYIAAQPGSGVKSGNAWSEVLRAVLMPVRVS